MAKKLNSLEYSETRFKDQILSGKKRLTNRHLNQRKITAIYKKKEIEHTQDNKAFATSEPYKIYHSKITKRGPLVKIGNMWTRIGKIAFAHLDGFETYEEMYEWLEKNYNEPPDKADWMTITWKPGTVKQTKLSGKIGELKIG
jgi:hypothetical protein